MTVTYSDKVATSNFSCFLKLLFRWRGSIYKLMWRDFAVFAFAYFALCFLYRFVLDDQQQAVFERLAIYCEKYNNLIPVAFVLGFFVTLVIGRWWNQFTTLPWPDRVALVVTASVHGHDDRGRLMRRTIMRYFCLSFVIMMASISPPAKKRFPTFQHMTDAGFMLQGEQKIVEDLKTPYNRFFMPLVWATTLVTRARKEGRIKDDFAVKTLVDEITDFRSRLARLFHYDWISVPLVYTQVVTLAVYTFFLSCLLGRQILKSHTDNDETDDAFFPAFTFLQFFFYMGWLKVGESLINPFGEDDDDFDVNGLIDRHLRMAYIIVDEMNTEQPEMIKDQYWDEPAQFELPYTVAAQTYRTDQVQFVGSAANIVIPSVQQSRFRLLESPDDDDEAAALLEGDPEQPADALTASLSLVGSGTRTRADYDNTVVGLPSTSHLRSTSWRHRPLISGSSSSRRHSVWSAMFHQGGSAGDEDTRSRNAASSRSRTDGVQLEMACIGGSAAAFGTDDGAPKTLAHASRPIRVPSVRTSGVFGTSPSSTDTRIPPPLHNRRVAELQHAGSSSSPSPAAAGQRHRRDAVSRAGVVSWNPRRRDAAAGGGRNDVVVVGGSMPTRVKSTTLEIDCSSSSRPTKRAVDVHRIISRILTKSSDDSVSVHHPNSHPTHHYQQQQQQQQQQDQQFPAFSRQSVMRHPERSQQQTDPMTSFPTTPDVATTSRSSSTATEDGRPLQLVDVSKADADVNGTHGGCDHELLLLESDLRQMIGSFRGTSSSVGVTDAAVQSLAAVAGGSTAWLSAASQTVLDHVEAIQQMLGVDGCRNRAPEVNDERAELLAAIAENDDKSDDVGEQEEKEDECEDLDAIRSAIPAYPHATICANHLLTDDDIV